MKIGVPFNTAWDMVDGGMAAEVMAYIVASGEMDGGKYDWKREAWKKD